MVAHSYAPALILIVQPFSVSEGSPHRSSEHLHSSIYLYSLYKCSPTVYNYALYTLQCSN